jgi:hypothetical protein
VLGPTGASGKEGSRGQVSEDEVIGHSTTSAMGKVAKTSSERETVGSCDQLEVERGEGGQKTQGNSIF